VDGTFDAHPLIVRRPASCWFTSIHGRRLRTNLQRRLVCGSSNNTCRP